MQDEGGQRRAHQCLDSRSLAVQMYIAATCCPDERRASNRLVSAIRCTRVSWCSGSMTRGRERQGCVDSSSRKRRKPGGRVQEWWSQGTGEGRS